MNKKKKWDKPMLLILTKGKPEEGVLSTCKQLWGGIPQITGPVSTKSMCELFDNPTQFCYSRCNAQAQS